MAALLFWMAIALVGYSYVIYPIVVALLARLAPQPLQHGKAPAPADAPAAACVIAAFNEENVVAARVANVLAQSYPAAKLTLYIASDGSRDRTGEIVSELAGPRVRAFAFATNRGKATVLNELVATANEDILVFSDANTMFEPDAIARLVARFDDPRVGVVCGELRLLASNGSNQDSAYWRMEQFLKRCEARIGGLLGANGGIYAVRRTAYRPIASTTIVDDFCIAMTAAAEGWKLVYEPAAVAIEDTPDQVSDEYRRRVRIGIGNYQALFRHPEYLMRTNAPTRFAYVSHKVLRWLTPHLMIVALVASAVLGASSPFYAAVFAAQLAVYAAAAAVWYFGAERRLPRLAAMVFMFVALNWAFLVAFAKYVTGRYSGSWRTTTRALPNPGR